MGYRAEFGHVGYLVVPKICDPPSSYAMFLGEQPRSSAQEVGTPAPPATKMGALEPRRPQNV